MKMYNGKNCCVTICELFIMKHIIRSHHAVYVDNTKDMLIYWTPNIGVKQTCVSILSTIDPVYLFYNEIRSSLIDLPWRRRHK